MILITFLTFALLKCGCGQDGLDQWWYDLGDDDLPASDYLAATSPFYNWFQTARQQFDAYAPAFHVGKINRGTFLNPELNLPADRAFGQDSDFNAGELNSGTFSFTPKAQKFVAKKIHVDAGLATKVGQIATMPVGVFVQDDGTFLVDTGMRQVNPCNPSPCSPTSGTPRCIVVGPSTAKCIGPERKKLELKWMDPVNENGVIVKPGTSPMTLADQEYDLDLIIMPSKNYDGSPCSIATLLPGASICGVTISTDKAALGSVVGKETATLETTSDDAKFKDYTYAIYALNNYNLPPDHQDPPNQIDVSEYNLNKAGLKLNLYDDVNGVSSPAYVYTVPQGSTINSADKWWFFFGCIRPNMKGLDTRGAGFYWCGDPVRGAGTACTPGLCEALLNVVPALTPGFA